MSNLKIGWAETDITPDKKVSLFGQFAERISEYIEKPLTATALAIDSGENSVIFCSCDLEGVAWNLLLAVRERLIAENVEFNPQNIILNAIHTHTGYGYGGTQRSQLNKKSVIDNYKEIIGDYLSPGQIYIEKVAVSDNKDVATNEENFALLVDKISFVVKEAWANRSLGYLSNAFGRVPVGMCRRAVYSDNTAQMWGDTNTAVFTELESGNDSGMELLYVFDENKQLTGIISNIACPAQCVQHRHFISPDFWGEVKLRLRNHFGEHLYLLPQCSAAGDQCPVDLIRWVEPESDINDPNCVRYNPPKRKADPPMFDLSGMKLTGRRIANEIIQVLEDGLNLAQTDVPFEHRIINMPLPLRRATLSDKLAAEKAIREYFRTKKDNIDYIDIAKLQIHFGILQRFELQDSVDCLETEIHIIRIGNIAFATNPFELFLDYGNLIKARACCEQTFIVQLANGTEGYLPTRKAEIHGHYSAFISSGQVGHEGGDLLVRQTLTNLNEMFVK